MSIALEAPLGQLADLVDGTLEGDGSVVINGVAGIREACKGQITFLACESYARRFATETTASAIVLGKDLELDECRAALLRVDNPDRAFATIAGRFAPEPVAPEPGVHPTAVIADDACIGDDVCVGAGVVIESCARIGDRTVIRPQCYVGHDARIGADCFMHPGVKVLERSTVGDRVIIHSGAVIGSDGFGFETADGEHVKIPQQGIVEIEDDVEVGANVTIDRARFAKTHIGRGTKIDNLVQIAHNVWVGEHCFVVSQAGIAGSSRLGDYCILAGQSGTGGHIELGDRVVVAARAGVTKNTESGSIVSGFPAQPRSKELRQQACVRKLPELCEKVRDLQERLTRLEATPEDNQA